MTQLSRPYYVVGAAVLLSAALTACGGGSDSADNGSANGTISKTCAINGDTVSVTQEGCLASFGNNTHSLVCSGTNTLHMLTGTGLTRDQVVLGGSSITSGRSKIGLVNGLYAVCI